MGRDRTQRRKQERTNLKLVQRGSFNLPALERASVPLREALIRVQSRPNAVPSWVQDAALDADQDAVTPSVPDLMELEAMGLAMPLACGVVLLAWEQPWNFVGHFADMREHVDKSLLVEPCELATTWLALLKLNPDMIDFSWLPGWTGPRRD